MSPECAQDPELFFPEKGASITDIRTAKTICAACGMRTACLTFALDQHIRDGIWGGTTRDERIALLRQRRTA